MTHLEKMIEEFEKLIPPTSVVGLTLSSDLKHFLISSHLSYLQSVKKRLEGEVERYPLLGCVGLKFKDDGVHIDYKCLYCGQSWGEEERIPECRESYNKDLHSTISAQITHIETEIKQAEELLDKEK